MNKKLTVLTTAAVALAMACTMPNIAQASETSAFGPAAHPTAQSAAQTPAADTADDADTDTDDVRPILITSSPEFERGEKKTITGTATPGAEITVVLPGSGWETTVDADEQGVWTVETRVLTGSAYTGNQVFQYVDGSYQGHIEFDLELASALTSLRTEVQSRTADSVRLGITFPGAGHLEIERDGVVEHTSERTNGNATTPVTLAAGPEATTFTVHFTPRNSAETLTKQVTALPFDTSGLAYVPVTIDSGLDYRYGEHTVLRGHGAPGGTVRIQIPGSEVDTTATVGDDGTWESETGALRGSGYDGNTVSQSTDTGTNSVRFSMLAQLEVTGLQDDDVVAKRPTVSGLGDEGATITLTDGGTPTRTGAAGTSAAGAGAGAGGTTRTVLGTATVAHGTWEIVPTTDLAAGVHDLVVSQESFRGETLPIHVRVEVQDDDQAAPFAVTTPASGTTVSTPRVGSPQFPNAKVTFSGTGTPDATIELRRHNQKLAGTTTVGSDGSWTLDADMGFATYPTTTATQTVGTPAASTESDSIVVRDLTVSLAAAEPTLVITSPTAGQDNVTPVGGVAGFPNARMTVTGEGVDGDRIRLLRPNGKVAGSGTVGPDGTFAFDADVNWGTWTFTVQALRAGAVVDSTVLESVTVVR